jgi:hypothetical protein
MRGFHDVTRRPNKLKAISSAIVAAFDAGYASSLCQQGIVYYTLGGVLFNDLQLFYNVFHGLMTAAISYEDKPDVLPNAERAARKLRTSGRIGDLDLRVLPGDIFDSDLSVVPRTGLGLVLFLDTYDFLTVRHQVYFERWILSQHLVPGDLVYVTTSLPPWEFLRGSFRELVGDILKNYGIAEDDIADRGYLEQHYIPVLLTHFVETWRYRRLSQRGLRHFYCDVYRDTRIPMALNGFVVI